MHETVLWEIGGVTFHGKTLIMMWIVMAIVFIFCRLAVRNLTSGKPGKLQNVLEWLVDFVSKIIGDNMNPQVGRPLLKYLLSLIIFIFFSNLFGLLPNFTFNLIHTDFLKLGEIFHGANFMSPTADINVTLGLAILTMIIVVAMGVKHKGAHYFKHFLEPHPIFLPIHLIDFVAKPMTLGFRLFGNIYAGEVLIAVIMAIPGLWVLAGALPETIWLGFSIFVGAIQSFVFTVLTTAYIAQAVNE